MQLVPSKPLFELRPYQQDALEAITRGFQTYQHQLAVKPTGCHAAGHPILMADGIIKSVETIRKGDQVMGPDSRPRTVLQLHQGRDAMFRITPVKGEQFVVNAGHLLHLRRTPTGDHAGDRKPWSCTMALTDYLNQTAYFKHLHKLERKAVEFPSLPPKKPWHISPYILGVAIGDGCLHQSNIAICTPDREIVRELEQFAHCIESDIRVETIPNNKASSYYFKGKQARYGFEFFRYAIRRLGLDVRCEKKFVPLEYKLASRTDRLEILAGLLDTDGHLTEGGFEYSTKSLRLAADVLFMARSVGLAAYQSEKIVKDQPYQRIYLSGDCSVIPTHIERKKAPVRQQIKNVLVTGFVVEPAGEDDYFGFTLDGDHLYLDGTFTIHHNSGKTVLFAALANHYQPRRTLVLAHREELISQAVDKIMRTTGLAAEVEMAHSYASSEAPVVVASVQTMMRESRRKRWARDHFGLIVVDEAHHSLADSYLSTLRYFDQNAFVLGVTATPDRSDKRTLGAYYENIAFEISLLDLIKQRWLSPITVKTLPLQIDLDGVRTVAGDYSADDLGHALDPYLEEIARMLAKDFAHRKILVFLPLITSSQKFTAFCRRFGLRAEHVDGGSPDRRAILGRFNRGESTLLSNAMLLTEGYDEPSIDCIVCLRPTKIRSLYSQIVGRGTRLHPGKDHLLLLDFLWLSERHNLVKPAHLIAQDDREAQAITEKLEDDGDLAEAQEAANADRTRGLVEQLRQNRTRNSRTFDALEFALTLNDPDLAQFEPSMRWHADQVTPKQTQMLAQFGIDPVSVLTKGHAAALLDRIFMRMNLKLASAKQVRWLCKLGHPQPALASFKEASAFLNTHFNH